MPGESDRTVLASVTLWNLKGFPSVSPGDLAYRTAADILFNNTYFSRRLPPTLKQNYGQQANKNQGKNL